MAERRSSSVSPNVSSTMIIPKREPIENDFLLNNKRRFADHHSHEPDPIVPNKRQMATKKHQHSDNLQSKLINGRNGNNDEQQQQKQMESSNTQKLFPNGGNNDISSSSSTSSSSANTQSKPRYK
jgi:hypothetical protein